MDLQKIRVGAININGYGVVKRDFLAYINEKFNIDVLGITESWCNIFAPPMNTSIIDEKPGIRINNRCKEGSAVIRNNNSSYKNLNISKIKTAGSGIIIKIKDLLVGFIYISPTTKIDCESMIEVLEIMDSHIGPRVLIGDFNSTEKKRNNIRRETVLMKLMKRYNWIEAKNDLITFIGNVGTSSPDRIFTNIDCIKNVIIETISDHRLIYVDINLEIEKVKMKNRYDLKKLKDPEINTSFKKKVDERCTKYSEMRNIEYENNRLGHILKSSADIFRKKEGKKRVLYPSLPSEIKDLITRKRSLKKNVNWKLDIEIIGLRKEIKRKMKIWFRELRKDKLDKIDILDKMDELENAEKLKLINYKLKNHNIKRNCDVELAINSLFNPSKEIIQYDKVKLQMDELEEDGLEWDDFEIIIENLPRGKAPGFSNIYNEMIKESPKSFKERLYNLMKACWNKGIIPKQWKLSKIFPLIKEDGSIRPISLLENFRKIYERLIKDKLELVFNEAQFGFIPYKNTIQQAENLNYILKNKKIHSVCAIDIKSAYDNVDRNILWRKCITNHKLQTNMVIRLQSIFEENEAAVVYNNITSKFKKLDYGVTQGSILSPWLFNIFIDDIAQEINLIGKNKILLYADDIVLIAENSKEMNAMLRCMEAHSRANNYQFNVKKCKIISNYKEEFNLNNEIMENVKKITYLGIPFNIKGIDEKELCKKNAEKNIKAFMMNRRVLYQKKNQKYKYYETMMDLYRSFCKPKLEYGTILIDENINSNMDLLESSNYKCLRMVLGGNNSTEKERLLVCGNIINIKNRIRFLRSRKIVREYYYPNEYLNNLRMKNNDMEKRLINIEDMVEFNKKIKNRILDEIKLRIFNTEEIFKLRFLKKVDWNVKIIDWLLNKFPSVPTMDKNDKYIIKTNYQLEKYNYIKINSINELIFKKNYKMAIKLMDLCYNILKNEIKIYKGINQPIITIPYKKKRWTVEVEIIVKKFKKFKNKN